MLLCVSSFKLDTSLRGLIHTTLRITCHSNSESDKLSAYLYKTNKYYEVFIRRKGIEENLGKFACINIERSMEEITFEFERIEESNKIYNIKEIKE